MKRFLKLILAIALGFTAVEASAQVYAGGGFTFEANSYGASLVLSPEVGYWITNEYAAGAVMDIYACDGYSGVMFSPYGRWSFAKLNIIQFFVDGFVSIGGIDNSFVYGMSARPGFYIPLSRRLDFVSRVGGLGFKSWQDRDTVFNFDVLTNISFSMVYNF